MISIKTIGKKRNNGDGTSSKSVNSGFANTTTTVIAQEVQGVNIWGQYHDHSGDVDGDMMVNGNITTSGDIVADGGINCGEVIATDVVTDEVTTNRIDTNSITVNSNATISTLNSTNANITNLSASDIDSDNITTEYLTVTKQAHFFNLTIDEIKSVGGQIILSAANATIDHVEQLNGQYVLCWKKDNGEDAIGNQFKVNDQIICQTFNKTDVSTETVANKYYWGLVTMVGEGSYTIDGAETECHYIVLSSSVIDGSSVPEAGDKICQLGYRGTDDNARQSAIILSAYKSPDPNVTAPSIVQYAGINTFSLNGCIVNQLSPTDNIFTGEFKVISNGTTTDVVDLIQGQHPQIITDSEQAWIMADSSSKTYYQTDYQNLPTVVQAYLGSDVIPYSEWTTGSQIKFKNQTINLTGNTPSMLSYTGMGIHNITRNTNDVTISWQYTANTSYNTNTQTTTNNGTTENNTTMEITIVFTHNGTTYTISKNVPFNMIKASAVTQGADAEFDKLMVDKLDLTVTLDNKLTCNVDAKVYHVKGSNIAQVTDLTDYSASLILSNNQTVSLTKSSYFYRTSNISNAYSSMSNPPTSAILKLMKNGTLVDEVPTVIKFNAGSIFTVRDNAITAAVQQANSYTDTEIAQVELTADGISSRVTAIENDYVTGSELTQTANNIQLNVYDELLNKTGIDISNEQITLNGNTLVNGNLTLSDADQGFTLVGENGITQIMPKSIGTYNDFTALTTTTIAKSETKKCYYSSTSAGYHRYRANYTFTLGTIESGKRITFLLPTNDYYLNGTKVNSNNLTSVTDVIDIYEDGVMTAASQSVGTTAYNYTSQGGNITVTMNSFVGIVSSLFTSDPSNNSGNSSAYDLISNEDTVTKQFTLNVTIPNDKFILIGYDGIGMNFGSNKNVYIGEESSTFRYGQYGFKIDATDGVQIYNGTYWYSLDEYIGMIVGHS